MAEEKITRTCGLVIVMLDIIMLFTKISTYHYCIEYGDGEDDVLHNVIHVIHHTNNLSFIPQLNHHPLA